MPKIKICFINDNKSNNYNIVSTLMINYIIMRIRIYVGENQVSGEK